MATTNFNVLSVRLARIIEDPVATYDLSGSEVTAALRTEYLNRANIMIQEAVWKAGKEFVEKYLQGLVATEAGTMTGGSKALPAGCSFVIGFQKAAGARATYVPPEAKPDLDNNSNPNLTLAYTILANTVYGYENGAAIGTGAHVVYYIKSDQVATPGVGAEADITIDQIWWQTMLDIAASLHFSDKGDGKQAAYFFTRAMESFKSILR